jgi:hypothetical protein
VQRLRLVHWHADEAEERAERLRALGYVVDATPLPIPLRRFAEGFDAVVIDLGRLPSQGRDVGVTVRLAKSTRTVPLVFVGGSADKVARVRETLPDAAFTTWERIAATLRHAKPQPDVVVPSSALAGYAATPLPKKLGIRDGTVVAIVGAPDGFEDRLEGAVVRRTGRGRRDLTIVFLHEPRVERTWEALARNARVDDVWLVWAKKSSGSYVGLAQAVVRKAGLERGFVDFKVCAIDETWTGLRFKRRS